MATRSVTMAVYVLAGLLLLLWVVGFYSIVSDDHRYSAKHVAIGVFVFPYTWWIGGKTLYHLASTSPQERKFEEECLNGSEALGIPPQSRVRLCDCVLETHNAAACSQKVLAD